MNTVRKLTLSAAIALVLSGVMPSPATSAVDLSVRRSSEGIPATVLVNAQGSSTLRLTVVSLAKRRTTSDITLALSNGQAVYDWDAADSQGQQLPAGDYLFSAEVHTASGIERIMRSYFYSGRRSAKSSDASGTGVPLIEYLGPDVSAVSGGASFDAQYRLSRSAHVRAFLVDGSGRTLREISTGQPSSALSGDLDVLCTDAAGAPLVPGNYRVVFSAFANGDKASASLRFSVIAPANALAGPGSTNRGTASADSGSVSGGGSGTASGGGSASSASSGHTNNGVRDHGQGEGRDGAGQGKGNGVDQGKK
ncbi:MAG: hypothetical protein AAB152_12305 [Candidatus Coatesbacteria bacterium]